MHFSSEEALEKDGVYELGHVYIATKKALKEEAERGETMLADEVQAWLGKFEAGLKGVSGPYVQYAAVRVNKILLDKLTFKLWG